MGPLFTSHWKGNSTHFITDQPSLSLTTCPSLMSPAERPRYRLWHIFMNILWEQQDCHLHALDGNWATTISATYHCHRPSASTTPFNPKCLSLSHFGGDGDQILFYMTTGYNTESAQHDRVGTLIHRPAGLAANSVIVISGEVSFLHHHR